MQFYVFYVAVFVPSVAVLVAAQTVLESAAAIPDCIDRASRYTCSSTWSQESVNVAVQCGPDFYQFAENQVAQCTTGEDGGLCFTAFRDLNTTRARACSSVTSVSSCTSACSDFLEDAIDMGGCCFSTVFNERFSQIVFGYNIQIALNACSIVASPACKPSIDLTPADATESCTSGEFWRTLVERVICNVTLSQPYVDALLKNDACTPIARHYAGYCGRANNRFCLDILQTSFPLVNPTRSALANPHLSDAMSKCANYSSFSEMCPTSCKDALQTAIEEFGCCINMFNDSVNEVLVPHFGGNVMTVCGLDSPGICKSVLDLTGAGVKAVASWICVCLAVLMSSGSVLQW